MSPASPPTARSTRAARPALTALALATGLLLAGCGGDPGGDVAAEGHDHS
ncbi:MAG: hypothetical protein JWR28_2941, partial [Modestobacter sp.]|nr:hypothetical protein [Modestobacter sp.]